MIQSLLSQLPAKDRQLLLLAFEEGTPKYVLIEDYYIGVNMSSEVYKNLGFDELERSGVWSYGRLRQAANI